LPCTWPQKLSVIQYARRAHARISSSWHEPACILLNWAVGNWRKKFMHHARGAPARVWQFTLPGYRLSTFSPLVLSHAIENQNSDFVMA
jgi:hypothetical protein